MPRGLYTPVYQGITGHRKVIRVAAALHTHRLKLVGHLVALWTWSLTNMPADGGPMSAADVAFAAEWDGRDVGRFARELHAGGFLRQSEAGYYVHEWEEYGGKVAVAAERERRRKSGSIPRDFRGNSAAVPMLERDIDLDPDSLSLPPTPLDAVLTDEQERVRVLLHRMASDELLGGVNAPPSHWCNEIIRAGATVADVEHAIRECMPQEAGKRAKGLKYCETVLRRVVEEGGADAQRTGTGGGRGRATGRGANPRGNRAGGVGTGRGGGASTGGAGSSRFAAHPPGAIGADAPGAGDDNPRGAEGSAGSKPPIRFRGRAGKGRGAG